MTHDFDSTADPSPGQDTASDALRFLSLLYGDNAPDWLSIWTLSDQATSWYPANRLTLAAKYALSQAPTDNVYVGLGLREHQLGKGRRGQSADVMGIPGFWIEIDIKHAGHKKVNLPETVDEALALVRYAIPLAPTLIILSGYGIHVYWLFRELWRFEDDDDRQSAYHLLHRLQATVMDVAKKLHGWDVDSTFDLARVLRVPGTFNRKVPNEPQLVTILEAHDDQRYNPGDFTEHLITVDEILYPTTSDADASIGDLSPIDLDTLQLKPWDQHLIKTGKDRDYPDKYPSKSEAHKKATEVLIEAGLDDQTIMSLLLDPRYDISVRPRQKGQAWLAKDIARIRSKHNWNTSTYPPNGQEPPHEKPAVPIILNADEITEQPMQWLWHPYIPRDMLVMLDGDPGLGKSMMLLQVASNLSRSFPFQDQFGKLTLAADVNGPQTTLILSAEDSLPHVMIPRLKKAGADLKYIKFLPGWLDPQGKEQMFTLQHLPILEQAIQMLHPVLVILDPLVAYLGDIDMHRSNQTRPLMAALKTVAEQHRCTIMGVRHPSKMDQGGPLMYRGQGNMDIVGAARSALWVQKHPAHPEEQTLMIHSKTNVGMFGRTVIFSRARGEFEWVGVSRLAEWMISGKGPDPYALLEAFFWLEETMQAGVPLESAKIEKDAADRGISHKVLSRARNYLGIVPKEIGRTWWSTLPPLS